MTTPKREEIEAKAIENFFEDQHSKGFKTSITPTTEELKESGYYSEARSELMRNEDSEYTSHIEQEARRLGFIDDKVELGKQRKPFDFDIDIDEALRSGVFVCGGKGTTKSNLAIVIADRLMKEGITVKVFDISQAWRKSSIPKMVEVKGNLDMHIRLYESVIFDLSRLIPKDVKRFIAHILACEWNAQISVPESERKWIVYIFEESQMLVPQGHLRSVEAQYVLRLMTSGRNFKLGYVAITQRPALTDTSVFELTFQRYFARMDGQNDLKKVGSYIGIEKAKELQNLRLGEFIYDFGSQTKRLKTEEFRSSVRPRKVLVPTSEPIKKRANETHSTLQQIAMLTQVGSLLVFALLVVAVALGV